MPDDTLSPIGTDVVPYDRVVIKTRLAAQERYAMALLQQRLGPDLPQATFVRHVLIAGMEAIGGHEDKRIKDYAAYRIQCLRRGVVNPYESE